MPMKAAPVVTAAPLGPDGPAFASPDVTVNEVIGARFGVNLIPHTLAHTNFARLAPGVDERLRRGEALREPCVSARGVEVRREIAEQEDRISSGAPLVARTVVGRRGRDRAGARRGDT